MDFIEIDEIKNHKISADGVLYFLLQFKMNWLNLNQVEKIKNGKEVLQLFQQKHDLQFELNFDDHKLDFKNKIEVPHPKANQNFKNQNIQPKVKEDVQNIQVYQQTIVAGNPTFLTPSDINNLDQRKCNRIAHLKTTATTTKATSTQSIQKPLCSVPMHNSIQNPNRKTFYRDTVSKVQIIPKLKFLSNTSNNKSIQQQNNTFLQILKTNQTTIPSIPQTHNAVPSQPIIFPPAIPNIPPLVNIKSVVNPLSTIAPVNYHCISNLVSSKTSRPTAVTCSSQHNKTINKSISEQANSWRQLPLQKQREILENVKENSGCLKIIMKNVNKNENRLLVEPVVNPSVSFTPYSNISFPKDFPADYVKFPSTIYNITHLNTSNHVSTISNPNNSSGINSKIGIPTTKVTLYNPLSNFRNIISSSIITPVTISTNSSSYLVHCSSKTTATKQTTLFTSNSNQSSTCKEIKDHSKPKIQSDNSISEMQQSIKISSDSTNTFSTSNIKTNCSISSLSINMKTPHPVLNTPLSPSNMPVGTVWSCNACNKPFPHKRSFMFHKKNCPKETEKKLFDSTASDITNLDQLPIHNQLDSQITFNNFFEDTFSSVVEESLDQLNATLTKHVDVSKGSSENTSSKNILCNSKHKTVPENISENVIKKSEKNPAVPSNETVLKDNKRSTILENNSENVINKHKKNPAVPSNETVLRDDERSIVSEKNIENVIKKHEKNPAVPSNETVLRHDERSITNKKDILDNGESTRNNAVDSKAFRKTPRKLKTPKKSLESPQSTAKNNLSTIDEIPTDSKSPRKKLKRKSDHLTLESEVIESQPLRLKSEVIESQPLRLKLFKDLELDKPTDTYCCSSPGDCSYSDESVAYDLPVGTAYRDLSVPVGTPNQDLSIVSKGSNTLTSQDEKTVIIPETPIEHDTPTSSQIETVDNILTQCNEESTITVNEHSITEQHENNGKEENTTQKRGRKKLFSKSRQSKLKDFFKGEKPLNLLPSEEEHIQTKVDRMFSQMQNEEHHRKQNVDILDLSSIFEINTLSTPILFNKARYAKDKSNHLIEKGQAENGAKMSLIPPKSELDEPKTTVKSFEKTTDTAINNINDSDSSFVDFVKLPLEEASRNSNAPDKISEQTSESKTKTSLSVKMLEQLKESKTISYLSDKEANAAHKIVEQGNELKTVSEEPKESKTKAKLPNELLEQVNELKVKSNSKQANKSKITPNMLSKTKSNSLDLISEQANGLKTISNVSDKMSDEANKLKTKGSIRHEISEHVNKSKSKSNLSHEISEQENKSKTKTNELKIKFNEQDEASKRANKSKTKSNLTGEITENESKSNVSNEMPDWVGLLRTISNVSDKMSETANGSKPKINVPDEISETANESKPKINVPDEISEIANESKTKSNLPVEISETTNESKPKANVPHDISEKVYETKTKFNLFNETSKQENESTANYEISEQANELKTNSNLPCEISAPEDKFKTQTNLNVSDKISEQESITKTETKKNTNSKRTSSKCRELASLFDSKSPDFFLPKRTQKLLKGTGFKSTKIIHVTKANINKPTTRKQNLKNNGTKWLDVLPDQGKNSKKSKTRTYQYSHKKQSSRNKKRLLTNYKSNILFTSNELTDKSSTHIRNLSQIEEENSTISSTSNENHVNKDPVHAITPQQPKWADILAKPPSNTLLNSTSVGSVIPNKINVNEDPTYISTPKHPKWTDVRSNSFSSTSSSHSTIIPNQLRNKLKQNSSSIQTSEKIKRRYLNNHNKMIKKKLRKIDNILPTYARSPNTKFKIKYKNLRKIDNILPTYARSPETKFTTSICVRNPFELTLNGVTFDRRYYSVPTTRLAKQLSEEFSKDSFSDDELPTSKQNIEVRNFTIKALSSLTELKSQMKQRNLAFSGI